MVYEDRERKRERLIKKEAKREYAIMP